MKFWSHLNIFIQENTFENVVWKMSAILWPQCVNNSPSKLIIFCDFTLGQGSKDWMNFSQSSKLASNWNKEAQALHGHTYGEISKIFHGSSYHLEILKFLYQSGDSVGEKLSWFMRHLFNGVYIFYINLWNFASDICAKPSEMSDVFRLHCGDMCKQAHTYWLFYF